MSTFTMVATNGCRVWPSTSEFSRSGTGGEEKGWRWGVEEDCDWNGVRKESEEDFEEKELRPDPEKDMDSMWTSWITWTICSKRSSEAHIDASRWSQVTSSSLSRLSLKRSTTKLSSRSSVRWWERKCSGDYFTSCCWELIDQKRA